MWLNSELNWSFFFWSKDLIKWSGKKYLACRENVSTCKRTCRNVMACVVSLSLQMQSSDFHDVSGSDLIGVFIRGGAWSCISSVQRRWPIFLLFPFNFFFFLFSHWIPMFFLSFLKIWIFPNCQLCPLNFNLSINKKLEKYFLKSNPRKIAEFFTLEKYIISSSKQTIKQTIKANYK